MSSPAEVSVCVAVRPVSVNVRIPLVSSGCLTCCSHQVGLRFVCLFVCLLSFVVAARAAWTKLAARRTNRPTRASLTVGTIRMSRDLQLTEREREKKTSDMPQSARHCAQHCCARAHIAHLLPSESSVAFYIEFEKYSAYFNIGLRIYAL